LQAHFELAKLISRIDSG